LWGNLADAWRFTGHSAAEINATYTRALELNMVRLLINPQDAARRVQSAYYLAHLGRSTEAVEAVGQARSADPENVNITFMAALVYERVGQRAKALEALHLAAAGGYSSAEILDSPDLAAIRLDPEFASIQSLLQSSKQKGK
jgi:eukaryotic-like serine/threonine-protein kinase